MSQRSLASKFTQFVDGAPTPFHSVQQAVKRLESSGFVKISEDVAWSKGLVKAGGKYYYTRNASTIVAFAIGNKFEAGNGFKVVGAHTDSPALKIKPVSKREGGGIAQVAAECYGGGLWYTWFDRDLGVAGRAIVKTSSGFQEKLVHIDRPILKIPSLAIHLQSADERTAFKVNKEDHLQPMLGIINDNLNQETPDPRHHGVFLNLLASDIGCDAKDIMDIELTLCDTQKAQIGGINDDFVFSPRLDNQIHCFTSIEALSSYCDEGHLANDEDCSIVVLFDHEEVGSESATGAGSPIMRDAVVRISGVFTQDHETFQISLARSILFSADGAHAVHPNYASKHERHHSPKLGEGTVIKTNDNQRYATNGFTGFLVRELARRNNLKVQEFMVRNDCPCGTTIGPIIASNTGIRTVDIGVPQWSMHSIRETCSVSDVESNVALLQSFFREVRAIDKSVSTL